MSREDGRLVMRLAPDRATDEWEGEGPVLADVRAGRLGVQLRIVAPGKRAQDLSPAAVSPLEGVRPPGGRALAGQAREHRAAVGLGQPEDELLDRRPVERDLLQPLLEIADLVAERCRAALRVLSEGPFVLQQAAGRLGAEAAALASGLDSVRRRAELRVERFEGLREAEFRVYLLGDDAADERPHP